MNHLKKITESEHFKKSVILVFFTVSAIVWVALQIYSHYYVSTEDAYINANVVQIAPRITGKVIKMYVGDNQYVQKGQALFEMDAEPFQIMLTAARAQVLMGEAALEKSSSSAKRTTTLVHKNFLSPEIGDNATASLKTAIGSLQHAQAAVMHAELNLKYTKVVAPCSGWVTNLRLQTGDVITANQPYFVLISDEAFWADANFKESELEDIHPGQSATVVTDLYPNHVFHATVESISSGTGSAFSLLPPENATGNWVKVTQRIPVRIRILNPDAKYPLRIGISATVKVKIH